MGSRHTEIHDSRRLHRAAKLVSPQNAPEVMKDYTKQQRQSTKITFLDLGVYLVEETLSVERYERYTTDLISGKHRQLNLL